MMIIFFTNLSKAVRNIIVACALIFSLPAYGADIELNHWPKEAAATLASFIKQKANQGHYAVFDMDNTSYQYDLTEALLPYLEMKGVITRDTLDPSLKIVPFKDENGKKESIYSYYIRLCDIDSRVCYPWISQAFSGLTLRQLKIFVDEMLAEGKDIPIEYYEGDKIVQTSVHTPRLFAGQKELYKALMDNGIEVYVITAANEELVRMVASDPKYGYNVKPENVIGVTTLLKNPKTGELTTSDKQIHAGNYNEKANLDLEITPYLWSPTTWMEGKAAAILYRIDRWKKPILAAGDTPDSDGYMLMNALSDDGIKVWVNRKDSAMNMINTMRHDFAKRQQELNLPVSADKNWVIVTPNEIH